MERLADRMRERIARTFVGRDAELALMDRSFAADPPGQPIFLVHGPGGIGKSCLLERARALAAAHGIASVRVDAREVEPTVEGLERALARALGHPPGAAAPDAHADADAQRAVKPRAAKPPRQLLVIDAFEHLAHLAGWLREGFLAGLSPTISPDHQPRTWLMARKAAAGVASGSSAWIMAMAPCWRATASTSKIWPSSSFRSS